MNWRAIGCGGLAAAAFVGIGILAVSRVQPPPGCPDEVPFEPVPYQADGSPTTEPRLSGVSEQLVPGGRASFGLAAWPVWVMPSDEPKASDAPLPERIVLECGDGTFQAYRAAAP